jgi:hypothetical protein
VFLCFVFAGLNSHLKIAQPMYSINANETEEEEEEREEKEE